MIMTHFAFWVFLSFKDYRTRWMRVLLRIFGFAVLFKYICGDCGCSYVHAFTMFEWWLVYYV